MSMFILKRGKTGKLKFYQILKGCGAKWSWN